MRKGRWLSISRMISVCESSIVMCQKEALRISHFAYDVKDARLDPSVVFPREALNRLVAKGTIASVSNRAYTFMGGIYSSRQVRDKVAPEITRRLIADEVDVVLMVPV